MANALYPKGKEAFGGGLIDWVNDDIRVIALTSGYAYDANDEFVSDLTPASNEVDRLGQSLANKSNALGVLDADDETGLAWTGSAIASLVLYKYNAADGSARLIGFLDTGTGLPLTPNGNVNLTWNAGGIFAL
jgi:hypothetical protein